MRKDVRFERSDLHTYQERALDFVKKNKSCGLFIDLGMGKTVIAATAAIDAIADGEVNKVLIIGPKRVASVGWPNEFTEWGHLCFYEMSVIAGTEKQRKDALANDCHFYTIGVDNVVWLVDLYRKKWPFDMVILDESSLFKSHASKRFKMLRRVRPYMRRFVELTATPAAEGYMGIFAQTNLADGGERFGNSITAYQEEYFTQNIYTRVFKIRPGAEEAITAKISDLFMVMKAEDHLDMHDLNLVPVPVRLNKKESQLYREMEEDSVVEIEAEDGGQVIIEAEQAASLQAKLLQLASGFIYDTKIVGVTNDDRAIKQKDDYQIHDRKFDALEELLSTTLAGENVLIAYHFKPTLARLKARFKDLEVMDSSGDCIKRWNQGKIRLLAAHPQSAGHGLNLQHGGHVIVYVDNPWSLERFLQFNGRLHRQGQKSPVTVYQMCAELTADDGQRCPTVDRCVVEALQDKKDVQEEFFRLLEKIKGRIRRRNKTKQKGLWDDEE